LPYKLSFRRLFSLLLRKNKKVGNAHSKLLAYCSFFYIKTTQNGKVNSSNFL